MYVSSIVLCKLCTRMPLCLVCCLIGLPSSPPKFQSQVSPFGREKSCWHFENPANDLSGQTGRDAGQTDPPFAQVSFPKSLRKSIWKKTAHMPSYPITKCITKRKSTLPVIFCLMRICHYLQNEIQVVVLTQTHRYKQSEWDFQEQPRNSTFEGIRETEIENVTLGWQLF